MVVADDVVVQPLTLPFLLHGVVDDGIAGDAVNQLVRGVVDVAVEVLDAQGVGVVAFGVNLHPLLALEMDVAEPLRVAGVDVLVFKRHHGAVVDGDEEVAKRQYDEGDNHRAVDVGAKQPSVTHAAAQNSDDFSVPRHFGGEEDNADEDEQGAI